MKISDYPKQEHPQVAILMGSDSDLSIMHKATEVLNQFGVSFDIRVISAHRTPRDLTEYIENAEQSGVKVFITAAGGAAHLPGVTAAHTHLPVIGVPIANSLDGMDALLSIAQMPNGIPVATVGIDRSKNAAILAVQILATDNDELTSKLKNFKVDMAQESRAKNN